MHNPIQFTLPEGPALVDGHVKMEVQVPAWAFEEAPARLKELMEQSPEFDGFIDAPYGMSEQDLSALNALFMAAFAQMPMGPYEHFRWLAAYDDDRCGGQYLPGFVAEFLSGSPDDVGCALFEMKDEALDALTASVAQAKAAKAAWHAKWEAERASIEAKRLAREAKRLAREAQKLAMAA